MHNRLRKLKVWLPIAAAALLTALLLAGLAPAQTQEPPPLPPPAYFQGGNGDALARAAALVNCDVPVSGYAYDDEESLMVELLNYYRAGFGLRELVRSPSLTRAAYWHANDQAVRGYFSHDNPERRFGQRMLDCAVEGVYAGGVGENIAAGYVDAKETMAAFENSRDHDDNIRQPAWVSVGIARVCLSGSPYGCYWVQDFSTTLPTEPWPDERTPTPTPTATRTQTPQPTADPPPSPRPGTPTPRIFCSDGLRIAEWCYRDLPIPGTPNLATRRWTHESVPGYWLVLVRLRDNQDLAHSWTYCDASAVCRELR